jgi:hypothetical protein
MPPKKKVGTSGTKGASASVNTRRSAAGGKGKLEPAAPSAAVEPTAVNKRKSTAAASKAEAATKPPPVGNVDKVPVPEKRGRGRPPRVPQVPKQQSLDEETADTEEDEEELRGRYLLIRFPICVQHFFSFCMSEKINILSIFSN